LQWLQLLRWTNVLYDASFRKRNKSPPQFLSQEFRIQTGNKMNAWNGQFLQFLIVGNKQFHAEFRRGCQVNRIGGRYRRGRSNNAISI
jgi:hypothetical protein